MIKKKKQTLGIEDQIYDLTSFFIFFKIKSLIGLVNQLQYRRKDNARPVQTLNDRKIFQYGTKN